MTRVERTLPRRSYADQYTNDDAQHPHVCLEEPCLEPSSNQRRWDSFARLWEPAMAAVPTLHAPGNHELETDGIAASITPQTQSGFGFPHNYPFQVRAYDSSEVVTEASRNVTQRGVHV